MPATYQGTLFRSGPKPDPEPRTRRPGSSAERQKAKLDLIGKLNDIARRDRPGDTQLDARQAAYELAFRMQAAAPEAVDLSQEPEKAKEAYGLNRKETAEFGHRCLLARRLVERGVRFVQVYCGRRQPVGRPLRPRREPHPHVPPGRPADRRADQGPEGPRPARRHARHLGRRVRPHADERRAPTAATTTPTASRCSWPAAA